MEQILTVEDFSETMRETIVNGGIQGTHKYDCPTSTGSYEFVEGDVSPKYFIPSSAE